MAVIGIDLGATKLAVATFESDGEIVDRREELIAGRDVASLIIEFARGATSNRDIEGIGMCVPGIYHRNTGTVWAPNIPGWENFPLQHTLQEAVPADLPVRIESDRACCILGEIWKGAAQGCTDAVFMAIGTGIGAGIVSNGRIIDGRHGIAGAIGWMALNRPFREGYETFGCFEYAASGDGLARAAGDLMEADYDGVLRGRGPITARRIFEAHEQGDVLATQVIDQAVAFWGMATANLVSLLDPEKIIFGGGVFGPAIRLLGRIRIEAEKWAQPISIQKVSIEASQLGSDAALYGAARLAKGPEVT